MSLDVLELESSPLPSHADPTEDLFLPQQHTPGSAAAHAEDFAGLRRFAEDFRAGERRAYTAATELRPAFFRALPHVDVVSLDIFDTALIRHVQHPVDVFFHLAQHPAFQGHELAGSLAPLRIAAEQKARSMVHGLIGSWETNLLEIYQVFCDLNGLSRDHAESFMEAEEQVELELCVACEPLQQLAREAEAAGKRVAFVSDTYHRPEFLLRLLQNIGYRVEPSLLFASSEFRKAKQDGSLFPEVLQALGITPQRLLHLGDHPVSDDKQPRNLGIKTLLHPHKASAETPELLQAAGERGSAAQDARLSQRSLLHGLIRATDQTAARQGHAEDFWWRFGYRAVGPMTTGFCQWLQQILHADDMEHAYFLLRDGELLHAVYQQLFQATPGVCPASTLDSSRRAMLLPAIELAPAFVAPSLLGGIGKRPLREYLERLHVPAQAFQAEARSAGFLSLDEQIDGRFEMERLLAFLTRKPVLEAVLARGRKEFEGLVAYLRQQGVLDKRKVALVDLGWSGTIHKSLQVLLRHVSPETRVTGYYLATFPEAPHSVLPGVEVRSYLAHRGQPIAVYKGIQSFLNLFETVYTSTEGSVLHFQAGPDGVARAVRQASDKSASQCRNLRAIHAGALAFAADYHHHTASRAYPPLPPEVASEEFFRVIRQPTPQEAHELGGLVHCDNLGSASTHISAELPETDDPAALLEAFQQIHWKQGALSLPNATAARLRTLLWLLEMQPSA